MADRAHVQTALRKHCLLRARQVPGRTGPGDWGALFPRPGLAALDSLSAYADITFYAFHIGHFSQQSLKTHFIFCMLEIASKWVPGRKGIRFITTVTDSDRGTAWLSAYRVPR